jgi:hypothetical protein
MEYIWPVLGFGTAVFCATAVGYIVRLAAAERNEVR